MVGLDGPCRGEIWLYEFASPDRRRPVLVMSRDEALPYLRTVIVAPVTSTIRDLPSEVLVGVDEGLKDLSVINFDNMQSVEQNLLSHYVGTLSAEKMAQVCLAAAIALGCDSEPSPR